MKFAAELFDAMKSVDFDARDLAWFLKNSDRLFFVGNGGSAAMASHMAIDFAKNGRKCALSFNDGASLTCLSNDMNYNAVFAEPLRWHMRAPDALIAISSSGRSENILSAVRVAKEKGADIITFSGFDSDNPLRNLGHKNYHVPSHDYGIVETAHLGMLHAALRELINAQR